jgi:hypothetical protein
MHGFSGRNANRMHKNQSQSSAAPPDANQKKMHEHIVLLLMYTNQSQRHRRGISIVIDF